MESKIEEKEEHLNGNWAYKMGLDLNVVYTLPQTNMKTHADPF